MKIRIGSRGSELALWQAHFVIEKLKALKVETELKIIKTAGDEIQNLSFDKMEGKGFFTKEIEEALLNNEIDLAVHSHKDLETTSRPELIIAAVSYREAPNDVLLIRKDALDLKEVFSLRKGAITGTSSARRKAQLLHHRPDIHLKDLRGNVPTRIQKLRIGDYDAIMLAQAGINRLKIDLSEFHVEKMDPRIFVPAPAQGVLGLQTRKADEELNTILQKLNHEEVKECIAVERELLKKLEGGCQLPLGAYCIFQDGKFRFWSALGKQWDSPIKRIYLEEAHPENLAQKAFDKHHEKRIGRVYISRSEKQSNHFFRTVSLCGYDVRGCSLTRYEQVPFSGIPTCDWIFFSSKNCVKYFFSQHPGIPKGVKVGSIGGATAAALKTKGFIADFTGESNDTAEIGKQFADLAGNSKVLFPQSTASFRTIQKQFTSQKNLIDMVVYVTVEDLGAQPSDADIIVLTSPTNAMLYLRKKKPQLDKLFIAIGKSTAEVLTKSGIKNVLVPWNTSEVALADMVCSL